MQAKIADFGLAKYMPQPSPDKTYVKVNSFCGTRGYATDEYMDGKLSPKLDVFSFGVVSISIASPMIIYQFVVMYYNRGICYNPKEIVSCHVFNF